jgi:hypothetical protein
MLRFNDMVFGVGRIRLVLPGPKVNNSRHVKWPAVP